MRVKTWVNIDQEIEISISLDEITSELVAQDDKGVHASMVGLNNCATFMKAIPDTVIAEMNEAQRTTIAKFMAEQSRRFEWDIKV